MLVLFDFGEVLGLPQTPEDVTALAAMAGTDPEVFHQRYWDDRHAYDSADLTDHDYWSAVAGRDLAPAEVDRLTALDTASWLHLAEEVLAVHDDLVAGGVPTALFSNAPTVIADAIDALPRLAAMRARYFSARLRLAKPAPDSFAAVLADLRLPAAEVVFVDDRPTNVAGARGAGLQALQFTGPARLRADLAALLGH